MTRRRAGRLHRAESAGRRNQERPKSGPWARGGQALAGAGTREGRGRPGSSSGGGRPKRAASHCSTPRHAERAGNTGAGGLKPGQPRGQRRGQRRPAGPRSCRSRTDHSAGRPSARLARAPPSPQRPSASPPTPGRRRDAGGGGRGARNKAPDGRENRGEETRAEGGRRAGRRQRGDRKGGSACAGGGGASRGGTDAREPAWSGHRRARRSVRARTAARAGTRPNGGGGGGGTRRA